jgi:hypothetical protein
MRWGYYEGDPNGTCGAPQDHEHLQVCPDMDKHAPGSILRRLMTKPYMWHIIGKIMSNVTGVFRPRKVSMDQITVIYLFVKLKLVFQTIYLASWYIVIKSKFKILNI